jgi:hypothetical protein
LSYEVLEVHHEYYLRLEVLSAVIVKSSIFWDMTEIAFFMNIVVPAIRLPNPATLDMNR